MDELIDAGDLEDYDHAPGEIQYIIVEDEINFNDPTDPQPYIFAPGSQIFMLPGTQLSIRKEVVFDGVNMFGCADPWTGIQVFANGTLRMKNSEMAQACEGIILSSGSDAEIILNNFIDNGKCIQAFGNVNLLGRGIAHNTFDGNNYSITPCFGVNTRAAIVLNNVPHITIGNPSGSGDPNQFINYFGISATNSGIDVHNSKFSDRPLGTGIMLRGIGGVHTANIFGLGNDETDPPFIENYRLGVDARNYNLRIENANFLTTVDRAMIRIGESNLPSRLVLSNNRFEDYSFAAIEVVQSTFLGVEIEDNKFFDNNDLSFTTSGIRWAENQIIGTNTTAGITGNYFYDEEKINTTSPGEFYDNRGITLTNSSNLEIEYNNFYQNFDTDERREYRGIWLNVAPENEIRNNLFYGNFGPSVEEDSNYRGIDAWESGNNLIACNHSEGFNQGFRFQGPACDQTTFRHNTMEDNLTGLNLWPGAIIGAQFEHENKWLGSLPGGGVAEAHFDGNPGQGLILMSKFWINSSNPSSTFWADPRLPTDDWFVYSGGQESNILHCYRTLPLPPSVSDAMIIDEEFEAYKSYPASEWEAALRAFGTLDNNPGLLGGSTPESDFYGENDTTNIGKIYRAMKDWAAIPRLTTGFESDWVANTTAIGHKLDTVAVKVAAMETAADTLQEGIALVLTALYEDLAGLQEDNEDLADEYLSDVADRADQLALDLGYIITEDIWEQNLVKVLAIFVERLQDAEETEWTTAHYDTLLSIADQCRHEGGIGVVFARAAIGQFDYDDEEMCPGFSEERISAVSNAHRLNAAISPNPAKDRCRIVFDRPMNGALIVRNLHGQAVRSINVSETTILDLNTQELPSGIYLLEAHTEEAQQFLTKLAIIR